ncbi:MAG: class I SAM-dependent methyltransferase [Elusimicrobiota bacterium]|nr:class I SAM-dependent methyltransferase [Elusimicrobiota bacterium]
MKNALKDLLLVFLVFIALVFIFYLFCVTRRNTYLFIVLALIILPNILAFIYGAPFVPTPMAAAKRMVEAAGLKPGDIVYDLGCGDGRVVYLAAKEYGVKGTGFELSPIVYLLARLRHFLWRSEARIKFGSFYRQDLSDADVIFCYLTEDILKTLEHKLKAEMKKGARVVSFTYRFASWKEKQKIAFSEGWCQSAIWIYEKD